MGFMLGQQAKLFKLLSKSPSPILLNKYPGTKSPNPQYSGPTQP
jgi:hypothetical protein